MNPAFLIHSNFVTVVGANGPTTIDSGDIRFSSVLAAIKSKNWPELENVLTLPKVIAKFSLGKVNVYDNVITYAGKQVHGAIVNRIFEYIQNGYPFEPIILFLNKLMENPSENSRNQLFEYIERYQMPIDDNGDVMAMKAVTSKFRDKWTGKIDNSVGQKPEMPRGEISDDKNVAAGPGLHHGWFSFVRDYGNDDDIAILTKFNPTDVVRIPEHACYQKIVVCKYEVLKNLGPVKNITDFSCNYAPATVQGEDIEVDEQVGIVSQDDISARENEGINDIKIYGANVAYEMAKNGQIMDNQEGIVVGPTSNKPRWYFRTNKGKGWVIHVLKIDNSPKDKKYIGKNKAYQFYCEGKTVKSGRIIINPNMDYPRRFFRKHSNWEVVE